MKNKNNQTCQKIELYGNPTTKELKKKHSFRLVGGAETSSWAERMHGKVVARGYGGVQGGIGWLLVDQVVPHLLVD